MFIYQVFMFKDDQRLFIGGEKTEPSFWSTRLLMSIQKLDTISIQGISVSYLINDISKNQSTV